MFDTDAAADAFVHALARDWRTAELSEAESDGRIGLTERGVTMYKELTGEQT